MISIEEAIGILSDHTKDFGIEAISFENCIRRILRENIVADRDMPPFDRVSMDGIAIRYEDFVQGTRHFFIEAMAAAGSPQLTLKAREHGIEIMTGSILPLRSDTIIPYEWLSIDNNIASIHKENVVNGQNVHWKGTDRKEGDVLIPDGRLITSTEVGVFAAVGKTDVHVSRLPKIIIISTGNELVEVDAGPLPHQVRISNVHQIRSALLNLEIKADRSHLPDEYDAIIKSLERHMIEYDVIILSGGISAGKYDFVPTALESLGVQKKIDKISQRPGKPFWFGTHSNGCIVFAIPGNPVSSYLCFVRYIRPWLQSCLKQELSSPFQAQLSEDVAFSSTLTYFLTVRLQQNADARIMAIPVRGHGSGDLANLVDADGFIELPAERQQFEAGEIFPVYRFET